MEDARVAATATAEGGPLEVSLLAFPSTLRGAGGREIPFARAHLVLRNNGAAGVAAIVPHGTLTREGGPAQDLSGPLARAKAADSLEPGEALVWDVYELLLAVDPAAASKVHLWGHKAILNWAFRLTAWFEYRGADGSHGLRTRTLDRSFLWSPAHAGEGVDLTLGPAAR